MLSYNPTQWTSWIFPIQKPCMLMLVMFHVLETTLRNFFCLTGDSIMVAYSNNKYYLDIIESKPANAISIIETNCEVDFAPPLDYKEPQKAVMPISGGKKAQEAGNGLAGMRKRDLIKWYVNKQNEKKKVQCHGGESHLIVIDDFM
ncbi:unnamed protein product [Lupinus luteus]|uniref:Ubiquitin fusion degradation protein UFD1 N-terminal subdomain 2 domain-containing protein n=1 Tax=Lupinus luteus TaxID=3873 RepID=A0AAV1X5P9_LUPLU